tara:strand:+ start:1236 stop:2150 length:915 start_codon:yes stop_codon:yes gene_type:complete
MLPLLALNTTPPQTEDESPADTGVARGTVFDDEIVWVAEKTELDAITCFPGGRCGYEAVFNLFPWAIMGPDHTPLVAQLFTSFSTGDTLREVVDGNYGLDSEQMMKLARGLYRNFVGLYAGFAENEDTMIKALNLSANADLYVQSFYDAEAMLMSGKPSPTHAELADLMRARFRKVKAEVVKAGGKIGADFVVNSGNHFKVFRMRDMAPDANEPLEWHVIDAWGMTLSRTRDAGEITNAAFNNREQVPEADAVEYLLEYAFRANPQAIAVVFRPKITKDPDNLDRWLNLWAAAKTAGETFLDRE